MSKLSRNMEYTALEKTFSGVRDLLLITPPRSTRDSTSTSASNCGRRRSGSRWSRTRSSSGSLTPRGQARRQDLDRNDARRLGRRLDQGPVQGRRRTDQGDREEGPEGQGQVQGQAGRRGRPDGAHGHGDDDADPAGGDRRDRRHDHGPGVGIAGCLIGPGGQVASQIATIAEKKEEAAPGC